MIPFLDMNFKPLNKGDKVEVKFCNGLYGETKTLRGVIDELNQYGGIYIILDDKTVPFTKYNHLGSNDYNPGDRYYICNVFAYSHQHKARIGYGKHEDFEHRHEYYCKRIE